jgi:hypothetical protein
LYFLFLGYLNTGKEMTVDWMDINCGNDFHWSGKSCDLLQLLTSDLNSNGILLDLPCSGQANRILIKFMKASQQLNILWRLRSYIISSNWWTKSEFPEKTIDLPQVTDKLYHIMLNQVHLTWAGFKLTILVVIRTDCIHGCKSNHHMITTTP